MELSGNHIIKCCTFFMSYHKYFTYFIAVFSKMARFSSRVLVRRVPTLISRFALTRQFCMTLLYSQNSKTRKTLICLLACIYLFYTVFYFHFCLLSGKTKTGAVISHLVEAYWDPLWDWLVKNREGIFKASEVRDFLEKQNTQR